MLGVSPDRIRRVCALAGIAVFAALGLASAAGASDAGAFSCVGVRGEPVACRVCLVSSDGREPAACGEAGRRIEAPAGTYQLRAVAGDLGLGANVEVQVGASGPPSVSGRELRLVPGGRARFAPGSHPDLSAVRIVSFATGRVETLRPESEHDVWVPSGAAVAYGVARDGSVVGLTRPWIQERGGTIAIPPFADPKPGSGHVLAVARVPGVIRADEALALTLRQNDRSRTSSQASSPGIAPISVFYDVPEGAWSLGFESVRWLLERDVDLGVRERRVAIVDPVILVARPSLEIQVAPLPWKPADGWNLTLSTCPADALDHAGPAGWPDLERCHPSRNLRFRGESATLEGLDPGRFFAVLEGDGRRIGQPVELLPARTARTIFEYRSTRIAGRVTRAGSPVPARITFEPFDPPSPRIETDADPNGNFEQSIWTRGLVRVSAIGTGDDPGRARQTVLNVEGEPELRADLELGWTDIRVRAVARDTGSPVPGATVGWIEDGSGRHATTDDSGETSLPALPPGSTRLLIKAEGYRPQSQEISIADTDTPQSFEVTLDRQRDENSFVAVLADGMPAAWATIFVYGAPDELTETAQCDASGLCRLATRPRDDRMIFGFAKTGGLTGQVAGDLLASGRLVLRPSGGDLVVVPRRGTATARSTLKIVLSLDGMPIPDGLLTSMAMSVPRSYQIYAFPGASDQFVLVGLPAGVISGEILARPREAAAETPFTPVGQTMTWDLPAPTAIDAELP